METKSLEQLREADERTLRFTPGGLSLDGALTAESAAQFQQELVAGLDFAPDVAAGTRQSFDRLRTIYAYGVLCYDIFTIVDGHALLVIEHALRDRFLKYHAGTVTFVRTSDQREFRVDATSYETIMDFLKTSAGKKSRLRVGAGPATVRFNGMLDGLHRWARAAGLLRGQRNRGHDRVSMQLRNFVAHPTSVQLLMPVDCVRTLNDLAEFINELWGHPTPGGRLYSALGERDIVVVAWDEQGGTVTFLAEQLGGGLQEGDDELRCVMLRGRFRPGIYEVDPGLAHSTAVSRTPCFPPTICGVPAPWRKPPIGTPNTNRGQTRSIILTGFSPSATTPGSSTGRCARTSRPASNPRTEPARGTLFALTTLTTHLATCATGSPVTSVAPARANALSASPLGSPPARGGIS